MNNSAKGLKNVNAIMVDQTAQSTIDISPLDTKKKKKIQESNLQGTKLQTTTSPYMRTRRRNQEKTTSMFIMDELKDVNLIMIQKNLELMQSLVQCVLGFIFLCFLFLLCGLGPHFCGFFAIGFGLVSECLFFKFIKCLYI